MGFAKTDVQPLINEGATREDIAASIFQAVVNQTIGGLACGKTIKGNVAFLGGPLYFLSELRKRFIETLKLAEEQVVFPENSQLFVAMGAALTVKDSKIVTLKYLLDKLEELENIRLESVATLRPLFANEQEYIEFKNRHEKHKAVEKV